jgi:long-chain acyl-CoA synthetase
MSTITETKPASPVGEQSPGATTIATRVRDRARSMGNRIAMREKEFGVWQGVTWASYWDTVLTVGHALLALGVEPGDRVAIHSENRREWLYSDVATMAVRAMTVGLYPTNPPAEVGYLLSHSGAKVLIAEDQEQVDKALAVIDQCPDLDRIVYIEPRGIRYRYDHPKLLAWDDLLKLGAEHRAAYPGAVEERMAAATPDDIATLIYTSGTTGPPKGAMLSVSNVEFAVETLVHGGGFTSPPPGPKDLTLSYLPLCHVAERIFTTWFNAGAGVQVNFAESIATVQPNLREVQPTILFGVPADLGADPGLGDDRAAQRVLAQAGQREALARCGELDRFHAGAHRRPAHHRDAAGLRARLGVLLPGPAGTDRDASGALRVVRRGALSRRRCSSSSWASAWRCTRCMG